MTPMDDPGTGRDAPESEPVRLPPLLPLPNYTLSDVCPRCGADMTRRACKVLCPGCGFMWDCSEL